MLLGIPSSSITPPPTTPTPMAFPGVWLKARDLQSQDPRLRSSTRREPAKQGKLIRASWAPPYSFELMFVLTKPALDCVVSKPWPISPRPLGANFPIATSTVLIGLAGSSVNKEDGDSWLGAHLQPLQPSGLGLLVSGACCCDAGLRNPKP